MGRSKLYRYAENDALPNVIQPGRPEEAATFLLKGKWSRDHFHNEQPLTLELGCGKGEYTLGMGRAFPDCNFIGVDIKGARIWRGAKTALNENLGNVAFLRTPIERIEQCFGKDEVSDIWITFPDPQPTSRREKKRLTGHAFLHRYHKILRPGGRIHLKTDSAELFAYTMEVLEHLRIRPEIVCEDVHGSLDEIPDMVRSIRTHYEQLFLAKGKNIHYLRFSLPDDLPPPPKKKKKQTQHIQDTIKP
ncbi:MAG: tRNA (guanosine(46)-N7)-methyltransferase TrmB [Flavobacteriales bacterium]|nr:tRNA (guanosine(46)-N7)-methyltransferase TrmB [Flavobacteriales bacterium]MCB9446838.1 tRNA (guanosine(46)-N7)-methyltransferase TrmB [Flavobacteriales bacterium]